jgi:hypothetical protein
MTMKTSLALLLCVLLAGNLCNGPAPVSQDGGASETVNARVIVSDTLASIVLDSVLEKPLSVRVYGATYKPYEDYGFADSLSDTGVIEWSAPSAGTYNFYLTTASGKAAFVPGVTLTKGISDAIPCVLRTGSTITGACKHRNQPVIPEALVLYIQGSPFVTCTDSSQHFTLNNLPVGRYTIKTRPAARFFFTTDDYVIDTDSLGDNSMVYLEIP